MESTEHYEVIQDSKKVAVIAKEDIGYVMRVAKKGHIVNYIVDTLEEAKNVAKEIFERGEK